MPAYATTLTTSSSAISFNVILSSLFHPKNDSQTLPESLIQLLRDPSLSVQKLEQLDPTLQDLL